jgi:uncharacterized protein (TIGR02099 family)
MLIEKFLYTLLRRLGYIFLGLLLFFTVVTTTARIFTPLLNEYRPNFEKWSEKLLGAPVSIGSLDAKWIGVWPDLTFRNVTVFSVDREQTIFHVDGIKISISLLKSVFSKSLQPSDLEVFGVHVVVYQLQDGSIQVQSFVRGQRQFEAKRNATELAKHLSRTLLLDKKPDQEVVFRNGQNVLLDWLFSKPHLSLKDVIVDVKAPKAQDWSVSLDKLALVNHGSKHVLYGVAKVLDPHLMYVHLGLSFTGDLRDQDTLSATLYVKLDHVLLDQWLAEHPFYGNQINKGLLNGEFWLKWEKGQLESVQTLFNVNQMHLQSEFLKKPLDIEEFSGNLLWKWKPDGWQVSGDKISLKMNDIIWPKNQFILRVAEKDGEHLYQKFWVRYLKIKDVRWFLDQVKNLPNIKVLSKLQPLGELWELFLEHHGHLNNWHDFRLDTGFSHLKVLKWNYSPGMTNLSGRLQLTPTTGTLLLHSTNADFDFGDLFEKPIALNVLFGNVHWYQDVKKTLVVKAQNIIASDDRVALSGHFGLLWPQDSINPMVSLLAGFDMADARGVKDYLPQNVLEPPLVNWLTQAFPGEGGISGTVIFRGHLKDFPFDHKEGVFIVDSDVHDLDFQYARRWPMIHDMNGRLIFENRSMSCSARSGKIQEVSITSAQAEIPYIGRLKPVIVKVKGEVSGQTHHLLDFVQSSPVVKLMGGNLSFLETRGGVDLSLDLSVPLRERHKTLVDGNVSFSNASFEIKPLPLVIDHVNGRLSFTKNMLSSGRLRGDLLGEQINFSIRTVKEPSEKPFTKISFQSRFGSEVMKKYFHDALPFIQGETPFRAAINLYTAEGDTRENNVVVSSDLSGIEVNLPKPFNKLREEAVQSVMTFSSKGLVFKFGNRMAAALSFQHDPKPWRLFSADLHFGEGDAEIQTEKGLLIDGFLEEFDWKFWREYLAKQMRHWNKKTQESIEGFLRAIHVTVGKIEFLGQTFLQATIRIEPQNVGFNVGIDSKNVKGDVVIVPSKLKSPVITGTFKRLHLVSGAKEKFSIPLSELPTLQIDADDVWYDHFHIGRIHLITKADDDVFRVKQLSVDSPELVAVLQGDWKSLKTSGYQSEISGHASSAQLARLFTKWKIHSNLVGTTGEATFHLNWKGTLYDPKLKEMNGNVSLKLDRGHIVKLDEATEAKLNLGFIVSLLSVHRLISMDFADLAQSGFSFDKARGDLYLQNGLVTTNNTYFDSSIAKIDVKGQVDLVQERLNLDLAIAPYITSSLPVIVALTGGPVAGAVVWLADKLVGKEVGKMASYHYKVTGHWDKPVIKEGYR